MSETGGASAEGQGLDIDDDDDDTVQPTTTTTQQQQQQQQGSASGAAGGGGASGAAGGGGASGAVGGGTGGGGGVPVTNPNGRWSDELPCDCSLSTMVFVLLNQVGIFIICPL